MKPDAHRVLPHRAYRWIPEASPERQLCKMESSMASSVQFRANDGLACAESERVGFQDIDRHIGTTLYFVCVVRDVGGICERTTLS